MMIVEFAKTTRTYATRAAAETAATKLIGTSDQGLHVTAVRVVIQAQYGRFSPVFVLTEQSMWMAGGIASKGFQVLA